MCNTLGHLWLELIEWSMLKIAFIPARIDSKGIKRKNLCEVGGSSLVRRIAVSAINSFVFDYVVLSSDSDLILNQVIDLPVKLHLRSKKASLDTSTASEVLNEWLNCNTNLINQTEDILFCYLQPTSPFTSSNTIKEIVRINLNKDLPVVTVFPAKFIPQKILIENQEGLLESLLPEGRPTSNRQELSKTIYPTGGVYCFRISNFLEVNDIPVLGALGYIVNFPENIDVDTPEDLAYAQHLASEKSLP